MKSFPSHFTAEKNKKTGAAPFWILECPFPGTGTVYLADYTVTFTTWKGGITTKSWIKNWGQITEDISRRTGPYQSLFVSPSMSLSTPTPLLT